jgi:uncharacterized HAD superfamily protein
MGVVEMKSDASEFMLEEYKQIATAYYDLHSQHNELVKFYLTMVALPASVLAIVIQFMGNKTLDPNSVVFTINKFGLSILIAVLLGLSVAGFGVLLALITTRAESLLYVRTVNCVRRYFVEKDKAGNIKPYLVVPDFDAFPPFNEGIMSRAFWNIFIVATINSVVVFVTLYTMLALLESVVAIHVAILASFVMFVVQLILYYTAMQKKENEYRVKFRSGYPDTRKIGIDLDGVLGDLAGAVIEEIRIKLDREVKREEINSHDLSACLKLTSREIKDVFTSDVFVRMNPCSDARSGLRALYQKGWVIHIITDRFWSDDDWEVARDWLKRHDFEYDHLNLVRGKDKAEYAKVHGISVFVEDNVGTVREISKVCDKAYLLDRTYNKGSLPRNVSRVASWDSIIESLE